MKSGFSASKPAKIAALAKILELAKIDDASLVSALEQGAAARLEKFRQGVEAYQNHSARRTVPDAPAIWQAGSTRLRDYNPHNAKAPIVLVVPSLINRMHIVDFTEQHSFVRTLARGGLRPLVVDWGDPSDDEVGFDLDSYLLQRLIPIADWVAARAPFGQFHVLGYCMGGLLGMMLAAHRSELCATISLLATPWDFHQGGFPSEGGVSKDSAQSPAPDDLVQKILAFCEQYFSCLSPSSVMPVDALQTMFFLSQPLRSLDKFTTFSKLDQASEEAARFVLLEDWLNDGVALSGGVARDCWQDWYRDNKTMAGQWRVGGKVIDPSAIPVPALVVVPGRDVLVPPEQALPLAQLLPRATVLRPMIGHIGLMASRRAPQAVWSKIIAWLQENV